MDEKPRRAPKFYAAVVAGIAAGVVMNVAHVDPIKALYWSAVANGVAAVPLVILVHDHRKQSTRHGQVVQHVDREHLVRRSP